MTKPLGRITVTIWWRSYGYSSCPFKSLKTMESQLGFGVEESLTTHCLPNASLLNVFLNVLFPLWLGNQRNGLLICR
jgi:hypothetical protein